MESGESGRDSGTGGEKRRIQKGRQAAQMTCPVRRIHVRENRVEPNSKVCGSLCDYQQLLGRQSKNVLMHLSLLVFVLFLGTSLSSAVGATTEVGPVALWRKANITMRDACLSSGSVGYAKAQQHVNALCRKQSGPSADNAALTCFRKRAQQRDAAAEFALGSMYLVGNGVAADEFYALGWLRKAAAHGHSGAQCELAAMYGDGIAVQRDAKVSASWARKSALQGDPAGQLQLAMDYTIGEGMPQDFVQAFSWRLKSARQGLVKAQIEVAQDYALGSGVATSD